MACLLAYVPTVLTHVILYAYSTEIGMRAGLAAFLWGMTAWSLVTVLARPSVYTPTEPLPVCVTVKRSNGAPRWCSKCEAPKPDRCHHCRFCRRCIVRMDHHCPWLMDTCIGQRNYKAFVLLLMYTSLFCIYALETTVRAIIALRIINMPASWIVLLVLVLFVRIWCLRQFSLVLTPFFGFHVYLMMCNMTTLEFIEGMSHVRHETCDNETRAQLQRLLPKTLSRRYYVYHVGALANMRQALGRCVLLWWLPIGGPALDLNYPINKAEYHAMQAELQSRDTSGAPIE